VTLALRPPRRNDRHPSLARWLFGGLLGLVAALTVLAVVPFTLANDALSATKKVELVASVVPALAFVVVGAVIVSRRPGNVVGWLCCVVGWLCCVVGLGQSLATFGGQGATAILAADPDRIPGGLVLYQLGGLAWELSWVFLALLLLLFPNGRPPSRRWRPAVWAAIAAVAVSALSAPFLPGPVGPSTPAVDRDLHGPLACWR
jgi:two-component system NarL family sensor kinase